MMLVPNCWTRQQLGRPVQVRTCALLSNNSTEPPSLKKRVVRSGVQVGVPAEGCMPSASERSDPESDTPSESTASVTVTVSTDQSAMVGVRGATSR